MDGLLRWHEAARRVLPKSDYSPLTLLLIGAGLVCGMVGSVQVGGWPGASLGSLLILGAIFFGWDAFTGGGSDVRR